MANCSLSIQSRTTHTAKPAIQMARLTGFHNFNFSAALNLALSHLCLSSSRALRRSSAFLRTTLCNFSAASISACNIFLSRAFRDSSAASASVFARSFLLRIRVKRTLPPRVADGNQIGETLKTSEPVLAQQFVSQTSPAPFSARNGPPFVVNPLKNGRRQGMGMGTHTHIAPRYARTTRRRTKLFKEQVPDTPEASQSPANNWRRSRQKYYQPGSGHSGRWR